MIRQSYSRSERILRLCRAMSSIPGVTWLTELIYKAKAQPDSKTCLAGVKLEHPLGVASGLDRTGAYCSVAASHGAAFLEIGPLHDVRGAIANLRENPSPVPVLANISGSEEEKSFQLIYDFVDAVVLNIPPMNFEGATIDRILQLRQFNDEYKPLLFKFNEAVTDENMDKAVDFALSSGIDGIIVPRRLLEKTVSLSSAHLDVMCCGVFENAADVASALEAGAVAVAITNKPDVYGPSFIKKTLKNLQKKI